VLRNFLAGKLKQEILRIWISRINSERVPWFPKTIQIEPTNYCNLRCPTCPQSYTAETRQNLTVTEFRRILDSFPFAINSVILSGNGEPLINPNFFSLIGLLGKRQINCTFYTNGTLLTTQVADAILSYPNITALAISCDGASKETFEALRSGADFDRWEINVRNFVSKALKRSPRAIHTTMFTVLSNKNVHEAEQILLYAADIGFESIYFIDPVPSDEEDFTIGSSCGTLSEINKERLYHLARTQGIAVNFLFRRQKTPPKAKTRCLLPWVYTMVRVNGEILPCPSLFGPNRYPIIGNLFQERFVDIWRGERALSFRKTSARGNNDFCSICPYY
jgi:radical SAM protein with 4Fe4S-binding SPASM domain